MRSRDLSGDLSARSADFSTCIHCTADLASWEPGTWCFAIVWIAWPVVLRQPLGLGLLRVMQLHVSAIEDL